MVIQSEIDWFPEPPAFVLRFLVCLFLGVPRRAIRGLDQGRDGDAHRDTQFPRNGRLVACATPIRFSQGPVRLGMLFFVFVCFVSVPKQQASSHPTATERDVDGDANDTQRLLSTARGG